MEKELLVKAAEKIGITVDEAEKNCIKLADQNAFYIWNPIRGGKAVIIDHNGEMLGAASSISLEKHVEAFISGKRN